MNSPRALKHLICFRKDHVLLAAVCAAARLDCAAARLDGGGGYHLHTRVYPAAPLQLSAVLLWMYIRRYPS